MFNNFYPKSVPFMR